MDFNDDDLVNFEAQGAVLPPGGEEGAVEHDGARIWYAVYGQGAPVILLHGGLGHGGNFAYQVPALVEAGYRAVVIDSRGTGIVRAMGRPTATSLWDAMCWR